MNKSILKQLSSVILMLTLLFSASATAYAEDGHAIGNFPDDNSGSDTTEEGSEGTDELLIYLSNGVIYSPSADLFYYTVENSTFSANVPSGTITTETVKINMPPALDAVLYKNGNVIEDADLTDIKNPGKYILAVTANDTSGTQRFNFTVVSSVTCIIKEYEMPTDFFVVSATVDGEKAVYSQSYVDMSTDGDYLIQYRSPEADKDFMLKVTVDHTAPTATLTGITDGKANCPVTVSGLEQGVKTYLTRNGDAVTFSETISETGAYVLTLKDEAGNETVYDFVVVTYANSSSKVLFAMGSIIVLALAVYLIYYRKFIRVS